MQYKLLVSPLLENFNNMVNDYLMKGWELYGSPVMACANNHPTEMQRTSYAQAMIYKLDAPSQDP